MIGYNLADIFLTLKARDAGVSQLLDQTKQKVGSFVSNIGTAVTVGLGAAVIGGAALATKAVLDIGTAAFTASSDIDAATKKMQSQLGLTEAGAKSYGDTLKAVFANNFGASIDDVADSIAKVSTAFQQNQAVLENESDDFLQRATEKSIALRDTYEIDVAASSAAVAQLTKNFGLSVNEAYDFIAFGMQQGLDANGDFLDTIGEYSTQFGSAGLSATQFFNVVSSGMSGVALGTDKAADALKEFRVRIQDGSELTKQGLEAIGLNSANIQAGLAKGTLDAGQVFEMSLDAIGKMTDKTAQFQAGVALFGTQFEDLGTEAFLALRTTGWELDHMTGAMDKLNSQYNTLPQFFEGVKRQSIIALTPITDVLLQAANDLMPELGAGFQTLKPIIDDFAAGASARLQTFIDSLKALGENSTFVWQPDFKQITIPDLFHFVQDGAGTSINIADWFYLDATDKWTKIQFSDLFGFAFGTDTDQLNIADWFVLDVDKAGFVKKLTLGDFFTFIKGDEVTTLNLGDYLQFVYQPTTGNVALNIKDILTFGTSGEGDNRTTKINVADFVKVVYEPNTGEGVFTVGDFFKVTRDEGGIETLNIADYVKVTYKPDQGITRLKIGDFIDLDSKDIEGIEAGFAQVGQAIQGFVAGIPEKIDRVKESVSQFLEIMGGAGARVTTGNTNFQLFIDTLFSIQDASSKVGQAIEDWATSVQESLLKIPGYAAFAEYIQGLTGAAQATRDAKAAVDDLGKDKTDPVEAYFKGIGATIKAAFTDIPGQIEGWDQALDGAGERVQSSLDTFEASVNAYGGRVKEAWDSYTGAFDTYKSRVSDQIAAVEEEIDRAGGLVKDFLTNLGGKAGDAVTMVIESPIWDKYINPLKWAEIIGKFLWDTYLDVLEWPTAISEFDWGKWIINLIWPKEKIDPFNWDTWLDILEWPDAIDQFGVWADWIKGIDLTFILDAWPGWDYFLNKLNPFASAPADVAASAVTQGGNPVTSTYTDQQFQQDLNTTTTDGTTTVVKDEDAPLREPGKSLNIGQVVVNNNVDAQQLIYDIGQKFVYGN